MNTNQVIYDEMEQYDFSDGEYLEKVADKYFLLIGKFLVSFSILEQELNIAIADFLHDDSHETGFVIIEKLTTSNKIDLFYKMYVRLESFNNKKHKAILDKLRNRLNELNTFRNSIVHANWQSLSKDGYVRAKIVVDTDEGFVKFKKVSMTPKTIRQKIKEIDSLSEKINQYKEKAFQF
ncbi:MAG: hypothetical protein PHX30_02155 [Candidatus Pacebacteria bacterium]|nr:hypothetical protein [Candidatus Paceibacterota bacterium]